MANSKRGEHPKIVRSLLGHASIVQAMDTYSHLLDYMGGDPERRAARVRPAAPSAPCWRLPRDGAPEASAWSATQPRLFHFRTQTGQEVDVVLEDAAGLVVGVEVEASATVGTCDFRGLHALSARSLWGMIA